VGYFLRRAVNQKQGHFCLAQDIKKAAWSETMQPFYNAARGKKPVSPGARLFTF
jgi:hypothetical protein